MTFTLMSVPRGCRPDPDFPEGELIDSDPLGVLWNPVGNYRVTEHFYSVHLESKLNA